MLGAAASRRTRAPLWSLVAVVTCACSSTARPPVTPAAGHHPAAANVMRGYATWYAESQQTASGERFDRRAMTAAHRSLAFGTRVRVTNEKNGLSAVVRINDRGPFGNAARIIDLSEAAGRALHMIDAGVVPVLLEVVGR